jgi:uncharacterized membrane protein YphA (DoxX/SURF4 family)
MIAHTAPGVDNTVSRPSRPFVRYLPSAVRTLLGLVFFASGIFGLLMVFGVVTPPAPSGPQSDASIAFMTGIMKAGYLFPLLKITELVAGAFLLANRCVPFALVLIAPVVVNILGVHAFLMPEGLAVALAIVAAEAYLGFAYRSAFRPLFARSPRQSRDA